MASVKSLRRKETCGLYPEPPDADAQYLAHVVQRGGHRGMLTAVLTLVLCKGLAEALHGIEEALLRAVDLNQGRHSQRTTGSLASARS